MTAFRSIALASLLSMAKAHNDAAVCASLPPVTCDEDSALVVESYEVLNGSPNGGNSDYIDDTYSPGGPYPASAQLSGGTGDLTDGTIATISWNTNKPPYVGWLRSSFPTADNAIPLNFKFTEDTVVSTVKISVDDPLPASSGGVTAPAKVSIGGVEYNFPANTSPGPQTGPYTASIQLDDPITVSQGDSLEVKLIPVPTTSRVCRAGIDSPCSWVFASEFTFFGSCSPTFVACVDQERARCCYKTDTVCGGRRELGEEKDAPAGGMRKLFPPTSCVWGNDVYSNEPTDLCLEECFAFGKRLCFLYEEFGLVHECDDSWWAFDGGN